MPTDQNAKPSVAVIGAGMSGLTAAKILREASVPFTVFEKAGEVGGTWRENTYPGLQCDVPALSYTFSFQNDPSWGRLLAPGAELQRQMVSVADAEDLRRHIRFGTDIVEARWTGRHWQLRTATGEEHRHDVLVHATGLLRNPNWPDIRGLDSFAGAVMHSAAWDHSVATDGRRVGVVGSGSTGVQIVSALAGRAGHLGHFARSPQWIFPLPDLRVPAPLRGLMARSPSLALGVRTVLLRSFGGLLGNASLHDGATRRFFNWVVRRNLRTVADPDLRARLTPTDRPLCKRPVMSTKYYRAVQKPGVELIDTEIDHIEPRGVVTADGTLHELDVLVLATGFHAHAYMRPMQVIGVDGVSIDDAWRSAPVNYRSVAVPGFPNMFLILGPNAPVTHISLHDTAEMQARYIAKACDLLARSGQASMDPRPEAAQAWLDEVRAGVKDTIWASGCSSWYLAEDGTPVNWPFSRRRWCDNLREPVLADYALRAAEPEALRAGHGPRR